MYRSVIFDMDGVIIDSEPLWEKAEKLLLSTKGLQYDPSYRDRILGLNQFDAADLLIKHFSLEESREQIINERLDILLDIYEDELVLKKDIVRLFNKIIDQNVKIGLASSSPCRVVEYVVQKIGLDTYFSTIVNGDSVNKGKPHPDIYLLAADNLGTSTSHCIAIEDSVNGVKSAKNAGMYCIAVPDSRIELSKFHMADELEKEISYLLKNYTLNNLSS